jgi:hypothetical protein
MVLNEFPRKVTGYNLYKVSHSTFAYPTPQADTGLITGPGELLGIVWWKETGTPSAWHNGAFLSLAINGTSYFYDWLCNLLLGNLASDFHGLIASNQIETTYSHNITSWRMKLPFDQSMRVGLGCGIAMSGHMIVFYRLAG